MRIDGDAHQRVTEKYLNKDEITNSKSEKDYLKIHEVLAEAYKSNKLNTPIYTYVKSVDKDYQLEFVATSSEEPYFRHGYSSFPDSGFKNLDSGGNLGLYKDEFGHWMTAFAPIKNSKGEIVGYVQADEKFDSFVLEIKKGILKKILFSAIGFMCTIFFLLPYLRQLLDKEEKQKNLIQKSLNETKQLSYELELKEIALKEYAAKLEESNRDLTDFAHIASHDLKAPVRNINSFSQLILRRNRDKFDEGTIENFNFIIKNATRAQQLIDGLLSYSTANKNLGEPVEFCIGDAAKVAQQNLATIIAERNVRVVIQDMPCIIANQTLISQVLQNLINNGIKYNQSEMPEIIIGAGESEEKGLYFFVQDNGIGIPKKFQADIFKMFTRLHGQQEYEGSGIGLAFCNRVVKTYEGEMWLESSEGKGARFYFTLPKAKVLDTVVTA